MLIDRPFDRSDLYIWSNEELLELFAKTAFDRYKGSGDKVGKWIANEIFIANNDDFDKTVTAQTLNSMSEFLHDESASIFNGDFEKSLLIRQLGIVNENIKSNTPEKVLASAKKATADIKNYGKYASKAEMTVDGANMVADSFFALGSGGPILKSGRLSSNLFGYDKDIDLNGTKSPASFDLRHSNNGTLDGGILRTVDGDFSIKYGSVIRGQSKIDDARIDEIFRNPITGGYSKNISAKSGSPANYSINSGKQHLDNDTSAQVRKSIEANRLAYQHTPTTKQGQPEFKKWLAVFGKK